MAQPFPADVDIFRRLPKSGRQGILVIEKTDGKSAFKSPLIEDFRAAGYALDYRGLVDIRSPG